MTVVLAVLTASLMDCCTAASVAGSPMKRSQIP